MNNRDEWVNCDMLSIREEDEDQLCECSVTEECSCFESEE